MTRFKFSVESNPQPRDVQALKEELASYAQSKGLSPDHLPLAVFLRDRLGRVVGGVYGITHWGLLWIHMVWVEESLRGQGYGTELMRAAERKALERGCHHARLETFALESFEFYEKLGYEVFGELKGHPPGSTTYFMR
jgi:GNAT superfamily N-acetyltransferase